MARIQITEPDHYFFETVYQIAVSDLNYGNHLSNDKVLVLAHETRMRWLKENEKSELDFWGTSLIQGDAGIVYKSEGFYGDKIKIELGVGEITQTSFDLIYKMFNETTGKPLALVKTRMVCFNYSSRKVELVPEGFGLKIKS
ncbi:MAG: esterase [Bacteroidetes bacterium]|nr:esterase [Bacteroidota bacterium]